jgi:hypothetical protein
MNSHWFFNKGQKEKASHVAQLIERSSANKDDSFTNFNIQNIYEMEGAHPHDEASHMMDMDNVPNHST